jgi:hypothetical protein
MVNSKARNAVDRNPLYELGILKNILCYVGPGHHLFLSTVCSLWRDLYTKMVTQMQKRRFSYVMGIDIVAARFTCSPQMTLYSAVFASASRVRLANECGVRRSTTSYEHAAGKYGTVESLMAARDLGMDFSAATMMGCAEGNQLAVLQYLHAQKYPWHWTVPAAAARRGDLQMLRWLKEQGCEWENGKDILCAAARSGNLEMIAWVKQQPGVVCDENTMAAAAGKGQTAICKYLHSEGCPWSSSACWAAASNGHVSTLRWLHEHGCPWLADVVRVSAAQGGRVTVLKYLQAEGLVEGAAVLTRMLNAAGAHDKLLAAQWLRQQGAEWPAVLNYYGTAWSGETLAWAKAEGYTSQ